MRMGSNTPSKQVDLDNWIMSTMYAKSFAQGSLGADGPLNRRSRQVPLMIATTLEDGEAPVVGGGHAEWDHVHVHDLSKMILLLAQQANLPKADANEKQIFGVNGYYFCASGTYIWSEVAEKIAKEAKAQRLIDEVGTKSMSSLQQGTNSAWRH
jgi:nucleoside-diphosphate-sugar epimerase